MTDNRLSQTIIVWPSRSYKQYILVKQLSVEYDSPWKLLQNEEILFFKSLKEFGTLLIINRSMCLLLLCNIYTPRYRNV
jgi:hypothetical protein